MIIEKGKVLSVRELTPNIFLIEVSSPKIARTIRPGQFCNIKVSETSYPLLRRPFSVCNIQDDIIYFMFDVHGEGTKILSHKRNGDILDILGPLGNGFTIPSGIRRLIILAGGLGSAPFPYLTKQYQDRLEISSFVGGRSKDYVTDFGLVNVKFATDDGSKGFKGTVLQLFSNSFNDNSPNDIKILACGPTPMLRAVKQFCEGKNLDCDISTESAMACGFGICQGCPIEKKNDDGSYFLVCKDGPVFNIRDVKI